MVWLVGVIKICVSQGSSEKQNQERERERDLKESHAVAGAGKSEICSVCRGGLETWGRVDVAAGAPRLSGGRNSSPVNALTLTADTEVLGIQFAL